MQEGFKSDKVFKMANMTLGMCILTATAFKIDIDGVNVFFG